VNRVGVVIPTRDRSGLLRATLHSALAQVDVDLEVVVVDDCSVDDTQVLLGTVRDPRVRVIRHDLPRGVAAARNAGRRAITAPWVALLDDDDLWAPDKLARQVAAAEAADASWVYGGAVEIGPDGQVHGPPAPPEPEALVAALRRRNGMPAGSSNVVVRADVLELVGGVDEQLRHLADWDLWLRLAAVGPPAVVRTPLVAYRQHCGQATLDTAGMAEEAGILAARHGIDPAAVHRWAAWSHLRAGRRGAAVRSCLAAVASGDVRSLGRAVLCAAAPRPASVHDRLSPGGPPPQVPWLSAAAVRGGAA
jgi:glycosyltransferase involved in cell wall biosynthesis